MIARLLHHKWGSFTDEKTGELKEYNKIVVCGVVPDDTKYNGNFKRGMLEDDYKLDKCDITPDELEAMYGKVVNIDFDQVVGSRYPNVVKISLLEGGEKK